MSHRSGGRFSCSGGEDAQPGFFKFCEVFDQTVELYLNYPRRHTEFRLKELLCSALADHCQLSSRLRGKHGRPPFFSAEDSRYINLHAAAPLDALLHTVFIVIGLSLDSLDAF